MPLESDSVIVPVRTSAGDLVHISATPISAPVDGEIELSSRDDKLKDALSALSGFAGDLVETLRELETSKMTVEFGCEFAVESGSLVAFIGKGTGKSAVKVTLEWTRPGS
ncbi:CU044_2847 family protein [Nonomuraea sp. SBT364]|uniref:CU044_2847 family protein n=1 Tax=Nonomuraea sp. SBT364 TaxID=1580530 RepID=UPI0007C736DE|nr:CU044_2847 family protein [Nonomuraea sp. SBT364]